MSFVEIVAKLELGLREGGREGGRLRLGLEQGLGVKLGRGRVARPDKDYMLRPSTFFLFHCMSMLHC